MPANETHLRTLARSLTWRVTGVFLAVLLAWILTGDLRTGFELGLIYNAIRFATQYLHDRWWAGVAWGRLHPGEPPTTAASVGPDRPPRAG